MFLCTKGHSIVPRSTISRDIAELRFHRPIRAYLDLIDLNLNINDLSDLNPRVSDICISI